jgi:aldehyde dehydrogenase (NAD+)
VIIHDDLFIGGSWQRARSTEYHTVVSPSTEEAVGRVPLGSTMDVDGAVSAARRAFDSGVWRRRSLADRRDVLTELARLLDAQADELGRLLTLENGMLLRSGHGRLGASVRRILSFPYPDSVIRATSSGETAVIMQEPAGVLAAIVPWNGPNTTIFKVIPAILAGCSVVLKPAPELALFTFVLAQACMDAGLPEGVLSIVVADRVVGEYLVSHPDVDMVSITGSTSAGKRVAAICGEQLKRVHLELGGKSAAIILDDVDVAETMSKVVAGGILYNNGEACAAWSRILVPRRQVTDMVGAMSDAIRQARVGDPFDPRTDLGPLISERQRQRVEGYIALAQQEGASVVVGGGRPSHLPRGWFVEPTLLIGDNSMRSSREEIFGPVATVMTYDSIAEAVEMANDSPYGLSAGVFSRDLTQATSVAQEIRSGTVGINCIGVSTELPFGGFKESGFGRHFGPEGTVEFLETKTITFREHEAPASV